ncbi:MAG: peptidoglycan-binding protein, partial [Cyanobacteria bacterium P01_D01_bin.56]
MFSKRIQRLHLKLQRWFDQPPLKKAACSSPLSIRPVLHEGFDQQQLQAAIEDLQRALAVKGFPNLQSGEFDQETKLAVEVFQRAHELTVDGIVGPLTWAALLYPTLSRTDVLVPEVKNDVQQLQARLRQERLSVRIDGLFGARTERALKQFQRRYGLRADGLCGPMTWSVLLGQRTEWDGEDRSHLPIVFVGEQLLIIGSIFAGIHFSPFGEGISFSLLKTLAIAYTL